MAEINTQDNQKVFNSSLEKFKSFVGGGGKVSSSSPSSKNLDLIHDNIAKLFDAFTKGTLMGQGSNSELLMRTIYRSLSEDFLDIIKDSDSVEKIIESIKQRQDALSEDISGEKEEGQ